jgi:hypothetical protein
MAPETLEGARLTPLRACTKQQHHTMSQVDSGTLQRSFWDMRQNSPEDIFVNGSHDLARQQAVVLGHGILTRLSHRDIGIVLQPLCRGHWLPHRWR